MAQISGDINPDVIPINGVAGNNNTVYIQVDPNNTNVAKTQRITVQTQSQNKSIEITINQEAPPTPVLDNVIFVLDNVNASTPTRPRATFKFYDKDSYPGQLVPYTLRENVTFQVTYPGGEDNPSWQENYTFLSGTNTGTVQHVFTNTPQEDMVINFTSSSSIANYEFNVLTIPTTTYP